eukprot:6206678-Pleurochrysis_carterae.AAC.1
MASQTGDEFRSSTTNRLARWEPEEGKCCVPHSIVTNSTPTPSRAGKHVAFPYTYPYGATYPNAASHRCT